MAVVRIACMGVMGVAMLASCAALAHGAALAGSDRATDAAASCNARAAPCGWINPLISMRFPGLGDCVGDRPDLGKCLRLPGPGNSTTLTGSLLWYWDMTQDGIYPGEPGQDVKITFYGAVGDPTWLNSSVDPPSKTVTTTDLFDTSHWKTDSSNPAAPRVVYEYEFPINVTISQSTGPSSEELRNATRSGGIFEYYLVAHASASGERYREAFGVQVFRFAAPPSTPGTRPGVPAPVQQSPAVPAALLVAILAIPAWLQRRLKPV